MVAGRAEPARGGAELWRRINCKYCWRAGDPTATQAAAGVAAGERGELRKNGAEALTF